MALTSCLARPAAFLLLLAIGGCDVPRDPEGTLGRVAGGTMRVGVAHPADLGPEEAAIARLERSLVQDFADQLKARIEWIAVTEGEGMERLHRHELDLLLAGLAKTTPWQKKVGLTRPFLETERGGRKIQHVLAAPPGENGWLVRIERFLTEAQPKLPQ